MIELEADENYSYFWMRQAKRRRRGWEPSGWEGTRAMFSGMPDHLHWMWFWGTHSKISSMGPEFLPTALRAITVPGPSTVYHLVFTPYSSFLTVTRLKWFSPHGGGRFSIGFSQTSPSLQAIDDACNVQCQACICHTRMFPRSLAWNPLSIMM